MKFVPIIQSRLGSTRLPNKVLIPMAGKCSLQWIVERIRQSKNIKDIIIATTNNPRDIAIAKFATEKLKTIAYRGHPEDVLYRVVKAGIKYKEHRHLNDIAIIDITGDCPLIDYKHIDYMIKRFKEEKLDYISNVVVRSFPDGFDAQIYKLSVLEQVETIIDKNTPHSCHTGWNILKYKDCLNGIKIGNYLAPFNEYFPNWGLTLDTKEDLELIGKILEYFIGKKIKYPSCSQIIKYIRENIELLEINSSIKRKTPGEG